GGGGGVGGGRRRVRHEIGRVWVYDVLGDLAVLEIRQGGHARGVCLLGAREAGRSRQHIVFDPHGGEWAASLAAARAALGPEGFEAARAAGQAMPLEEAVALAREGVGGTEEIDGAEPADSRRG